jgi:hypothetical protein
MIGITATGRATVEALKLNRHGVVNLRKLLIMADSHPLEVDAIVGSVVELGRLIQIPTPHIDAVHASVKLLEKVTLNARICSEQYFGQN